MLTVLTLVKLVAEIALMALLGRWVLGLLAGAKREQNLFWQVLDMMVRPFTWTARRLSPKVVLDRHVPLVAFLLLAFTWIVVTLWRIQICLQIGVAQCR
ncbi:hypothetical protein [Ramlibacter rhizophilus]|uniref:YggT family protein n=1 Tax=Ramlibacter rhizophilus TaxID=1781167 RepID=A0A4Z0BL84_9BURK|nr:hypothetical protein [Ramlibacter rhizophilus]TFY99511.1 hypothetical protein EZ242_10150 [Ramlibacter rhizophilus]